MWNLGNAPAPPPAPAPAPAPGRYETNLDQEIWVKIVSNTDGLPVSVLGIVIKEPSKDYISVLSPVASELKFNMLIQDFNQQLVDEEGKYLGEMNNFLGYGFVELWNLGNAPGEF